MNNQRYRFRKSERLSGTRSIGQLFDDGKSFFSYPFSVVWRTGEATLKSPLRVAVSVPKKYFKKAVDRNRLKRITREAWRYNKEVLLKVLEQHNKQVVLMLIYSVREPLSGAEMYHQIEKLVAKFSLLLAESNTGHLPGEQAEK